MPPDAPLEENKHWLPVPKNTVYAAEHLPVWFSVPINTLCFPLKEQLYAGNKVQCSDYYQLSLVATVGLCTQEEVYHTVNPPPVPPSLNLYLGFTMYMEVVSSISNSGKANTRFHRLNNHNCIHKKRGKMLGTALPCFRSCNPLWLRLSKNTLGP